MKYFIPIIVFLQISIFSHELIKEATHDLMSEPQGTYQDKDCGEVKYSIELKDLNKDNKKEVFVLKYGTCIGGITGINIDLLIEQDNTWHSQFNFSGYYQLLEENNLGFPDVMIIGRGLCFPIWRWNGIRYEFYKKSCNN